MLIKCKECELPISNYAKFCPHCGYTYDEEFYVRKNPKKRRMRLPNGFGQITEIKGRNLRKPFRAMITVGKTDEGRPISKILKPNGYFKTYNEAYEALMEYNKNPYELNKLMTVRELYDEWSEKYFDKVTAGSAKTIRHAWSFCGSVENIIVRELRSRHIKECMDKAPSVNVANRIKSMFNLMLDYGMEYEICDRNYARDFNIEKVETKESHHSFTSEEMDKLWSNVSNPLVNIILIQCYMGWRPQELCKIKLKDVDLEEMCITGGMKTEAGRNRKVPIHGKIQQIVNNVYWMAKTLKSDYFICCGDGSEMTYDKYYKKFKILMAEYNFKHTPHDPRKTFVTLCKNYGVDEYAIKYMVGHSISDLTESTYTDRDPIWLYKEIEKIEG